MSTKYNAIIRIGLYILAEDLAAYAELHNMKVDDLVEDVIGGEIFSAMIGGNCNVILPENSFEIYDAVEDFYFFELCEYPALFEAKYASYEDALKEMKDKVGNYLPADYDYERKFVEYYGVRCNRDVPLF